MGLREDIRYETVKDLPLRQVLTVPQDATVEQAMQLMRKSLLGCVFVVDEAERPLGKFTERELVKHLAACRPLDESISQCMVPLPDAAKVRLTDPIQTLLENMQKTRLRFICVVDEQGKVVALTGQKGLMEYLTEHFPRQIKVQIMSSKLYMNDREGA